MKRWRLAAGWPLGTALLLSSPQAWADRVALLPARGPDENANNVATIEATRALIALGHSVVPVQEVAAAVASSTDGKPDTSEELRAVGRATKADWVVVGTIEPAVITERVELEASLVSMGRVESVAREVEKANSEAQIREMMAVLLRPEGIGPGEMPWEHPSPPPAPPKLDAPPPPLPPPPVEVAPPPRAPSGPPIVAMDYALRREDVWPPYSAGRRVFVSAALGFSVPAARPGTATGSGAAFVGSARGGYAPGDSGLELFGELAGNLAGPRALWFDLGGRWMFTPAVHRGPDGKLHGFAFHIGPEITLGGFVRIAGPDVTSPSGVRFSESSDVHFTLGASLDAALSLTPSFQLEARLGDLRWVPMSEGSLLLAGATLGAGLRF